MSKKLTIVIHNLDEEEMKEWWKDIIKMAKEDTGVPIEETDTINIDAQAMTAHYPYVMSKFFPAVFAGHVAWTASKIFKSKQ